MALKLANEAAGIGGNTSKIGLVRSAKQSITGQNKTKARLSSARSSLTQLRLAKLKHGLPILSGATCRQSLRLISCIVSFVWPLHYRRLASELQK